MAKGEHIKVRRYHLLYAHHGIDLGDGTVVHFGEPALEPSRASVRRTPWHEFARGAEARVVRHPDALPPEEVCARALSLVGERGYNLAFNNCEHFAAWCATGRKNSTQVWRAAAGLAAAGLVVAATAGIKLLRRG
jgi:hypothetical protein